MYVDMIARLRAIVEDFLTARDGRPPSLTIDDNLFEMGYLDSGEFFDLIMAIEEELGTGTNFFEADPADLVSVAGLARHAGGLKAAG